jgi:hypothetical protein
MFIIFLIIVTLSLICVAASFSVVGIASMFSYNYIPAMIMGITLEAGKISVAIYLFRYWMMMNRLFKYLLLTFLAALMLITSVGIFGFLSQGYQKTSEDFSLLSRELKIIESEYAAKKERIEVINNQILMLPADSVANKIRLSREFSDEQAELRDRLTALEPRIQELKIKSLAYESHIGPIAYVARMLHAEQDNVVFFAILMLVFVADPLAITLTIACNMVLMRYWEKSRPEAAQFENSPLVFDQFTTGIKAVVNDSRNKYLEKKEAKKAARIAREEAEAAKQAEIERKAEEARLAAAAKEAEAARKAEAVRQARLIKEAEKIRKKEEAKKAKIAKEAEKIKRAEEARQTRIANVAARKERAELARQAGIAEEAALAEKAEAARQARIAKAAAARKEKAEAARRAKIAEEARRAKIAEEAALAEKAEAARQARIAKAAAARKEKAEAARRAKIAEEAARKKKAELARQAEVAKSAARNEKSKTVAPRVKAKSSVRVAAIKKTAVKRGKNVKPAVKALNKTAQAKTKGKKRV